MASLDSDEYIKKVIDVFENSTMAEQKQLLRVLKLRKAKTLAKKIDGGKRKKVSEGYFSGFVKRVRSKRVGE